MLGAAAAIGRSFDPETLRRTSGRSDEETVDALEELVAHGLVREGAGDGAAYDFSHQKLRALVYEQTALARRQLLHGRVAAALSGPRPGGEQAALVAQHLRLAGDQRGRPSTTGSPPSTRPRSTPTPTRSSTCRRRSRSATPTSRPCTSGSATCGRCSATTPARSPPTRPRRRTASDPSALAPIEHKLGNLHHRRGEWDRAEAHLARGARRRPRTTAGLRARVQADLALTLFHAGDRSERRSSLATRSRSPRPRTIARPRRRRTTCSACSPAATARREQALGHLERSLELARELGDAPAEAAALNNLALVRRDAGELPAALELTERALALCSRYGDRHREAALENNLADLHHAAGHEDESMAHLKRAVTIFREVGADEAARLPEIWKLVSW